MRWGLEKARFGWPRQRAGCSVLARVRDGIPRLAGELQVLRRPEVRARIPKAELRKLVEYASGEAKKLFYEVEEVLYSFVPEERNWIGYIDAGHVSAYYPDSPSITKAEIEEVLAATAANGIRVENTRVKKVSGSEFHMLFASADMTAPEGQKTEFAFGDGRRKKKLKLIYGDYAELMGKISAE